MKKLLVLLSLLTLCSCGSNKTAEPQTRSLSVETTTEATTEAAMSEAEYKDSCKAVEFRELTEQNNALEGQKLTFTGEFYKKRKEADMYIFDVTKVSWGYDNTVLFTYDGEINFKQDDIITVYGESKGYYTYTSALGVEVTAPLIEAEYITVNPLS